MKEETRPGISNRIDELRKLLTLRKDSEHVQVLIRLTIGSLLGLYFFSPWFDYLVPDAGNRMIVHVGVVIFCIITIGQFVAILINPKPSVFRRVLAITLDISLSSYTLYLAGEGGAPMIAVYLWVITGNGFRYGTVYLALATVLTVIGFGIVSFASPFWRSHPLFSISMLFVLAVVPAYISVLLDKLQKAMKRATLASEAKSQFMANMSHELRTPLSGVIGLSDLLLETPVDNEQKELIQGIQQSARSQLALIEQILDISRIEAGKLVLHREDFDLNDLINASLMIFSPQARKKGLDFSIDIPSETPFLLNGDTQHLRQILINLIGNAIKFTERGKVQLRVRTARITHDTLLLRFEVIDTGIGIKPEEQEFIFDNFTQANRDISHKFGGTGLGTTIARQLVELMGGEIGVESTPGVGSTFWFTIPFGLQNPFAPGETPDELSLMQSHIIMLAQPDLAEEVTEQLKGWRVNLTQVDTEDLLIDRLYQVLSKSTGYQVIMVDQRSLNQSPQLFLDRLDQEIDRSRISVVLLARPETRSQERTLLNAGYSTVLYPPIDKMMLFNAVHAAHGEHVTEPKVISLFEHYRSSGGQAGLNILVAEDNKTNQTVLKGILEKAGHGVNLVNNGEEALELLDDVGDTIDLMILDMNMPETSGLDVIKTYAFLNLDHNIPSIILTANASHEARTKSLEAGASAFLTKPVDARALLDTIASLSNKLQPLLTSVKPRLADADVFINLHVLNELNELGSSPKFLSGLIQGFIEDGRKSLEIIRRSHHDKDFPLYLDTLHALRGSAGELGLQKLLTLCKQAESLRAYENGSELQARKIQEVEECFSRTCQELTDYLDRNSDELSN
jgi:two-component system sensor histidine kinase RpfC